MRKFWEPPAVTGDLQHDIKERMKWEQRIDDLWLAGLGIVTMVILTSVMIWWRSR